MSGAVVGIMLAQKISAGGGTPALVQSATGSQGFGTTCVVTPGAAITNGNSVIVAFRLSLGRTGVGVTDSAGGTYVLVDSCPANTLDASSTLYMYARHGVSGAPTTVTASWSGGADAVEIMQLVEVAGVSSTSVTSNAQNITQDTTPTVNLTTATANEFIFAMIEFGGSVTLTPDAAYTGLTTQPAFQSFIYDVDAGTAGVKAVGGTLGASTWWSVLAGSFT